MTDGLESLPAGDAADALLRSRVRPAGWRNPAPAPRYHLVVIGGGTAGLVTAAGAAGLGAKVALIERDLLGGDCLNTGCVPSKALIASARAWQAARDAIRFGGPSVQGTGDGVAALERMRHLRAGLSVADSAERFQGLGVDVFFGAARLAGPDTVAVDNLLLRFRRAVIATGSRPVIPGIEGLGVTGYHTSETIFGVPAPPAHLAILGGGPVGCELAQAFVRLGSRVTLMEQADRLLPGDDPDAAAVVEQALRQEGVELRFGWRVARVVGRNDVQVELHGGRDGEAPGIIPATALLLAVGREPRLDDLDPGAAGVRVRGGELEVDDRLRTSNRRIFAAGDVIGPHRFTHAADAQARLVIGNALFHRRSRASRLVIPWCTFTSPEVAHVGLHAAEAARRGIAVRTITVPLGENDRAVLEGATDGFLRVHLRAKGDRILGATVVAPQAGELIGEAAVAMSLGIGLGALGAVPRPYPTFSLAWRQAADQWQRGRLTPGVRRLLGWIFREGR